MNKRIYGVAGRVVDRLFFALLILGYLIGDTLFRVGRMLATEAGRARMAVGSRLAVALCGAVLWALSVLEIDDEL